MAAMAAAGLAFLQASAEEGAADDQRRHAMASAAAEVPWRRVLRHRPGRKEHGGGGGGGDDGDDDLDWRSWRIPPSGPSSRGHVAVDADAPEKEKKTATVGGGAP
ncbi:hypothetical protein OsJ_06001 [Oryza sativa Japonica Group]|nr:hypothetical protein OsJ_06001 [Oryza sativa Japonica Group]BAD27659.1 hypothetical protein [Oryza sativa Japonica Group]BAD27729.1 hypothetical protein [Oryza sativa Japonica Group]